MSDPQLEDRVSAIFGVYNLDGSPVEADWMNHMGRALSHRGPDGSGAWCKAEVGLGHRKLSSTAEAGREVQPLIHPPTGVVLVADARIDNRVELATSLGVTLDRATDGGLILAAYLQWGIECPAHLHGDFAFAVWDPRVQTLFCARDPMGVKPLYYHRTHQRFAFATETKALLSLPGVSRELNEQQVAIFLTWSRGEREHTLYRDVSRLPAAHSLTVGRAGGSCPSSFWRLNPEKEIRYRDPGDYAAHFRELFTASVRDRIRGVRPVATALSGGLDSSSIACVARQLMNGGGAETLHAVSLTFPDLPADDLRIIDEREFVEAVVAGGGLEWHPVAGDRLSPLADIDRVLWHLDEPSAAPNLFLHWGMYHAAQRAGAGVFLDGLDGDTTVSHGLGRLNGLFRGGDWETFETEIRAFADHRKINVGKVLCHYGLPLLSEHARSRRWGPWTRSAAELSRRFPLSRRDLLVNHGAAEILPRAVRRRWGKGTKASGSAEVLHPHLAKRLEELAYGSASGPVPSERESHLIGLSQPEYQLTLEMADKCAAAFGIEPRYPFFDRSLIEFCLAVPEEQKFAGGWPRLVFRKAMEGILPEKIRWRASKANLSPGFHRGFRLADRALVEDTDFSPLEPYADVGALRNIRGRYYSDPSRLWGDPEGYLLFRATIFARWVASAQA